MPVKKGDKIKVHYVGTLNDGTVFDDSKKHGKPIEFEVGAGQLIKGFDDAVVGMEKNEEKEIKIKPEDAYGEIKPELKQVVPRDKLKIGKEPEVGMQLMLGLPNQPQYPARIIEVNDKEITLDLNHPLGGKTLNFKITVVE